jgi:tetratricopeptide (TPR) repeat protein
MSQPQMPSGPPSPAELLAGYLQRQQQTHAAGLAGPDLDGEVVPYEAGPVQPIDARTAWDEAVAALRLFVPAHPLREIKPPTDWPSLVHGQEPAAALALCLGNFPQLVRDLHPLLRAEHLHDLRPAAHPAVAPNLLAWVDKIAAKPHYPQLLLAVALLRLARLFDRAGELLSSHESDVPAEWRPAWDNEKAALAWHRGETEEARRLWLAQPPSAAVLFNRGMAALFLDRPEEARPALAEAAERLPETSAWHHLARLYLSLAEMRIGTPKA